MLRFTKAALGAAFLFLTAGMALADDAKDRALVAAANAGDISRISQLLREGAAVDARDTHGRTALLVATHANQIEAARALIGAGADVNARDGIEDSPYLYAGAEGRDEILKMTLRAGADLKSVNRYGGTALIPAAHHGHPETVAILLATAIDKDHINKLGWTALLEAVLLGDGGPVHTRIVKLLLDGGANPSIADRDGVTPLTHARRHGYAEMARLLEGAGAR